MMSPSNHSAGVGVPLENVCVIGSRKDGVFHVRINVKGFLKLDVKISMKIK